MKKKTQLLFICCKYFAVLSIGSINMEIITMWKELPGNHFLRTTTPLYHVQNI